MTKDYTDYPTSVRVFFEDGEWFVDGIDGKGNYTESCWSYDTEREARDAVGEFGRMYGIGEGK